MNDLLSSDFAESYSPERLQAEARAVSAEFYDVFDRHSEERQPGFYSIETIIDKLERGGYSTIKRRLQLATAEGKVVQGVRTAQGREMPSYALVGCKKSLREPGVAEAWREALGLNYPLRKKGQHIVSELAEAWGKPVCSAQKVINRALKAGDLTCEKRWVPGIGLKKVYWIPKEEEG